MNEKKICLCLDTSTKTASVALLYFTNDGEIETAYYASVNDGNTHSTKIMPMTDIALKTLNIDTKEIDLFSVISGPGSFTGLRIGISSIKALADSLNKPVIGVSTIETLAYSALLHKGIIVPILDARNMNVYCGIFDNRIEFNRIKQDDIINIESLAKDLMTIGETALFIGDGVDNLREKIVSIMGDNAYFADPSMNCQRADIAGRIAIIEYLKNGGIKGSELVPNYVKSTSAKAKFN